ncbi:MAG: potassium channel family protein [Methylococcales bacterium]|nr:potassium channel family protein [Methylococcales bacterium]
MNEPAQQISEHQHRHGVAGNFYYLLAGLLITLLGLPFGSRVPEMGLHSMTIFFCLFMLLAVWSLAASRRLFQSGAVLVLCIFTLAGFDMIFGSSRTLDMLSLLLMMTFCCLSCYIAARNIFVIHRVDLNALVGAFCVYLLLGLMWAMFYSVLLILDWGTFTGIHKGQNLDVFPDLVYFSFVTLASLGYGDISPVGGLTRTLAYLETVTGQFYLAVMVAGLVGAYRDRTKTGATN